MTNFMVTITIVTVEETKILFRDHVYKLHHDIPFKLTSDRNARFMGRVILLVRHSIGHVYIFILKLMVKKRIYVPLYTKKRTVRGGLHCIHACV
jgi:hypothetical protein